MARWDTNRAGTDVRLRALIDAVMQHRCVPEFPGSASRPNPQDVHGPGKPTSADV